MSGRLQLQTHSLQWFHTLIWCSKTNLNILKIQFILQTLKYKILYKLLFECAMFENMNSRCIKKIRSLDINFNYLKHNGKMIFWAWFEILTAEKYWCVLLSYTCPTDYCCFQHLSGENQFTFELWQVDIFTRCNPTRWNRLIKWDDKCSVDYGAMFQLCHLNII